MNSVGIDVSKGKSMIAVMRPFGEIVITPYEVCHTDSDLSEKWVDFVATFWHCECVCGVSEKAFSTKYQKWCNKHGYRFSRNKAFNIYTEACGHFSVMGIFLQLSPADEPVYQFMDKKRAEGKPYRVYMMASANKFLRIYYAGVKAYLEEQEKD